MPILNKKKSFRDRLAANDQSINQPSTTSFAKGGEFETAPNYEPNPLPGQAAQFASDVMAEPKQTGPSPTAKPEEQVDEGDQQVSDYLAKSQTLDGADKNKVPAEQVPDPDAFNRFYRKWRSVPTELAPKDRKMFQDKLAQLDQKMIEAEEAYKENKNRMMWAEAAESLGQAIVQLFAAQDAAQNNWSMNGMKFDRVNWESKYDRALREFDSKKDTLAKQQGAISRELERAEGKQERTGSKEQSLLARDFFTTQARIEADARRKAKEEDKGLKDQAAKELAARKLARSYIKNYANAEALVGRLEAGDYKDDKEKLKIQDDIAKAMGANGHASASKDIKTGEGKISKTGGFWGMFQSDDFAPMKKYIATNKKKGIESVYRGYGVPVPADVSQALNEEDQPATEETTAPPAAGTVERETQDGRTAIFDSKTKKFIKYKD